MIECNPTRRRSRSASACGLVTSVVTRSKAEGVTREGFAKHKGDVEPSREQDERNHQHDLLKSCQVMPPVDPAHPKPPKRATYGRRRLGIELSSLALPPRFPHEAQPYGNSFVQTCCICVPFFVACVGVQRRSTVIECNPRAATR